MSVHIWRTSDTVSQLFRIHARSSARLKHSMAFLHGPPSSSLTSHLDLPFSSQAHLLPLYFTFFRLSCVSKQCHLTQSTPVTKYKTALTNPHTHTLPPLLNSALSGIALSMTQHATHLFSLFLLPQQRVQ